VRNAAQFFNTQPPKNPIRTYHEPSGNPIPHYIQYEKISNKYSCRKLTALPVMAKGKADKPKAGRSAIADVVAREYTIHLHKRVRL
jgi:hypothetical protein